MFLILPAEGGGQALPGHLLRGAEVCVVAVHEDGLRVCVEDGLELLNVIRVKGEETALLVKRGPETSGPPSAPPLVEGDPGDAVPGFLKDSLRRCS